MIAQDDSKEFFSGLKQETARVENNFNLEADDSDFEDMPGGGSEVFDETDSEGEDDTVNVALSAIVDADETADMCIEMINGVQTPIFLILHRKKLVKKHFAEKQDYKTASEVYAMDDTEIIAQYGEDNANRVLALKKRYNALIKEYALAETSVPLTDDEKARLKIPMKQMVAKSNFNVPPALALSVCMGQIIISRLIDVYWD